MCYGCYGRYGKPTITNERVIAAAKLIDKVYEEHGAGGHAHVVIDDWNLEDEHIGFCLQAAAEHSAQAEIVCLKALQAMTVDERASALALYDGFIDEEVR